MRENAHYAISTILKSLFFSLAASVIFLWVYSVTPGFIETFAAFGSDLPTITAIALKIRPFYLVAVVILLVPTAIILLKNLSFKTRRTMVVLSASLFIFSVIYLMFFFWAMYLPAFSLSTRP